MRRKPVGDLSEQFRRRGQIERPNALRIVAQNSLEIGPTEIAARVNDDIIEQVDKASERVRIGRVGRIEALQSIADGDSKIVPPHPLPRHGNEARSRWKLTFAMTPKQRRIELAIG